MISRLSIATALVAATSLLAPAPELHAQEGEQPFEFALFSPLQVRGVDTPISVLRLSLLYGENPYVLGLDLGIVARNTSGESKGLQWAVVGFVEGDFLGWQNGWLANVTKGQFTGFQGPTAYNHAGSGELFQLGLVNFVENASGFQLGIVNFAENLYGLQIGLINIIQSKTRFSFLPIVNWSF